MSVLQKLIPLFFSVLSRLSPKLAARLAIELLFKTRRIARKPKEIKFWETGRPITFASGCKGRIFGEGPRAIGIVHGWHSQGSRFENLITACQNRGMQVVVWDGPGHGDSPGKRTNLPAFSRLLFTDLKALDQKFAAVLGHSFGAAAVAYICQLGLPADRLILLAGPSCARGVFERYWGWIRLGLRAQTIFVEQVEKEVQIKVDEMSAKNFVKGLGQKILVIHDEADPMIPFSDALSLKNIREDIELFQTRRLGHHRIVGDQDVVARVVKFLNASEDATGGMP